MCTLYVRRSAPGARASGLRRRAVHHAVRQGSEAMGVEATSALWTFKRGDGDVGSRGGGAVEGKARLRDGEAAAVRGRCDEAVVAGLSRLGDRDLANLVGRCMPFVGIDLQHISLLALGPLPNPKLPPLPALHHLLHSHPLLLPPHLPTHPLDLRLGILGLRLHKLQHQPPP